MVYKEDTGTVIKLTENKATVKLDHDPDEHCDDCCACSKALAGEHTVDVDRGDLKPGDRVSVRVPQVNSYLSMGLIFGLPLLLFFVGIYVGRMFDDDSGRIGSASIMGGIVGLVGAFGLSSIINKVISARAVAEAQRIAS